VRAAGARERPGRRCRRVVLGEMRQVCATREQGARQLVAVEGGGGVVEVRKQERAAGPPVLRCLP